VCCEVKKYNLNWDLKQLREVWTKNFKTSPAEEHDVEITGDGEGSGESPRDEDDFETLRNRCVLPMSRTSQQSETHHLKHRLISLRGGFGKTHSVHLE
jgi:hypothetical protein